MGNRLDYRFQSVRISYKAFRKLKSGKKETSCGKMGQKCFGRML
jgi:hypothetical protein